MSYLNINNDYKDTIIHGKNPTIKNSDKVFNITQRVDRSNVPSKAVDSDDPPAPKKISLEMANEIKNDRMKLSLTRADLAKKLALGEKIIASYEQEGTIIENKYYSKIKNYLKNAIKE